MTRTEKYKDIREILKSQSEHIKWVLEQYDTNTNYQKIFDDNMGNPVEQLENIFKIGGKDDL